MHATTDIRPAIPADEDTVRSVLDRSYRTLLKECYGASEAAQIAEYASGGMGDLLRSGRYYLALREGRVVACGGWSDQSPSSGIKLLEGSVFLRRFAVLPGFERHGLGRALFGACRNAAETVGAGPFHVRSTINAEPFYRSLAFGAVERTHIALPNGRRFGAILMKQTG
jgi:GNAT superfamily N-acetyltransferase